MTACECCGTALAGGGCALSDAAMACPPHVCLRWGKIIGDEDGCEPALAPLAPDHETRWRSDPRHPPPEYYR